MKQIRCLTIFFACLAANVSCFLGRETFVILDYKNTAYWQSKDSIWRFDVTDTSKRIWFKGVLVEKRALKIDTFFVKGFAKGYRHPSHFIKDNKILWHCFLDAHGDSITVHTDSIKERIVLYRKTK